MPQVTRSAERTERAKPSMRSRRPRTPPDRLITPTIAISATMKPMISTRKVLRISFSQ
jgi:hypothetical protein